MKEISRIQHTPWASTSWVAFVLDLTHVAGAAATARHAVTIAVTIAVTRQGLAQELRRSAAEELLALTPDPDLLGVMVQRRHLEHIWQLCVPPE